MVSKWSHLKNDAINLRKLGYSIRSIEKTLGISRSTLSGWFKNIDLTRKQSLQLKNNQYNSLKQARIKASIWHKQQKKNRLKDAERLAEKVLSTIDIKNKEIQELALAMLYLGEGFKTNQELGIGNSNSLILNFFINAYLNIFNADRNSITCELHLRADQNQESMKKYWSQALNLPIENFKYVSKDKRTIGSATFSNYKGVCTLRCGNVAVKRKLMYIAEKYCKKLS